MRLKFSESKSGSEVSLQLTSQCKPFVTSLHFCTRGFLCHPLVTSSYVKYLLWKGTNISAKFQEKLE